MRKLSLAFLSKLVAKQFANKKLVWILKEKMSKRSCDFRILKFFSASISSRNFSHNLPKHWFSKFYQYHKINWLKKIEIQFFVEEFFFVNFSSKINFAIFCVRKKIAAFLLQSSLQIKSGFFSSGFFSSGFFFREKTLWSYLIFQI